MYCRYITGAKKRKRKKEEDLFEDFKNYWNGVWAYALYQWFSMCWHRQNLLWRFKSAGIDLFNYIH